MLPLHVETHGNVPPLSDSGKTPSARTRAPATEIDCIHAPFLWAGSVRPGFVTPSNVTDRPRNTSPRAPCASVSRVEPVHRVLSSRAGCARPRALWRAILHTARPFLWVCINQHPQHYSSRPNCTHSTRVSFRYVPVRTSSTQQPHTEHSQKEFSMSLSACELRILAGAPC